MSETFIHESAYVDEGAQIGSGTRIWHFCHVNKGAVIGERCSLGQNVVVMNDVKIGNNVSVYDAVELEDDVFCGPSMVFTNVINPRSHVPRKDEYQRTRVKRGASIGANATIVCGVTLGEYSFIGAGSVVTDDVAPYALVVGVPGRRIGWICECGERLPDSGNGGCRACGKQYESHGATIERVSSG